jgi:hypothetical protein
MVAVILSACAPVAGDQVQAIEASTATAPPTTATIQWFPPTVTPSPGAVLVREPTPEMKPGVAGELLTDDFSSPDLWNTAVSDQAAVTVADNRLTIAVQPAIAPVTSFRSGQVFSDLYMEITARPSLCRGGDEYGLVFRAPNNSAYYRFALACNGTASAQRVSPGSSRILQAPTASGDVPLGAPGEVRLGVWAVGPQMHFFLNGRYQFEVTDTSYPAGGIGVFAHAAGGSPVTVTFSDLAVYSVDSRTPSGAPTP